MKKVMTILDLMVLTVFITLLFTKPEYAHKFCAFVGGWFLWSSLRSITNNWNEK